MEATRCDTAVSRENSRHFIAGDEYALSTQPATVLREEGSQNREGIVAAVWSELHIEAHQGEEYILQSMRRNYRVPSITKISCGTKYILCSISHPLWYLWPENVYDVLVYIKLLTINAVYKKNIFR